jgi:serine/threonine protein kinase
MEYTKLSGTTLGRYELRELLAEEAQLVATYKAYQPSLKRFVALQILNPDLHVEPGFREGFIRAAEIIADLEHSNIVPIHDYDVHDGLPFIAIRWMAGGSLRQRLWANPIPMQETITTVRQIANALDYVHSRGMVHGDPSIANILFDTWGSAYIGDFHVAGFQSSSGSLLAGTPLYTAPEKWHTDKATPASDQYALAAITYHMLAREMPFYADNVIDLVNQRLTAMPPPPQKYNPDIPLPVNDVLFRALAKNPDERYPTIADFAREFEKSIAALPQHLFISYSRRDKDYAQQLTDHLGSSGFTVWIDSQIEYGDTWFNEIDDAIKSSSAFLLLMTPESYKSEWVQKEILLAKRYKKPIFPLLLEGEEFGIVIDIQFADVRDATMPDANFHRRLRRYVFGDV